MAYRIESGVVIPPVRRRAQTMLDALRGMKKGQSIRLPKKRYTVATAAAHKVFGGGNYTVRSNGTTLRLWRTK